MIAIRQQSSTGSGPQHPPAARPGGHNAATSKHTLKLKVAVVVRNELGPVPVRVPGAVSPLAADRVSWGAGVKR